MFSIYETLRPIILPLKEIDNFLPGKGRIIELGCGQGVISTYVARNKKRKVIGVDINASRLPKNSKSNLKFERADIRAYTLKDIDGVVVSDVLHHLNREDQEKLLKNIAKSLKRGKTLIIKEIDTGEFVRSKLSRLWDFVLYPKEPIYFSNSKTLKKNLETLNFNVRFQKVSRIFPGSTTLYICTKR